METLIISTECYKKIEMFTFVDLRKEVCAFIYASAVQNNAYKIDRIVQVRNTRRISNSFGISKKDYEIYNMHNLIGIYHSHFKSFDLSEKDKSIFEKLPNIKFLLIGVYDNALQSLNLKCFTNKLNNLKINKV
jgi:proteasome lid subunit RPN8/RPN11